MNGALVELAPPSRGPASYGSCSSSMSCAPEPVALLEPQRVVGRAAARRRRRAARPPRHSRSHSASPNSRRRVDLPAELADVGDPQRAHRHGAEVEVAARSCRGTPRWRRRPRRAPATRSRARGPQTPMQHSAEVWSSSATEPSHGRWRVIHAMSCRPTAPPVTTRKRSSAGARDRQVAHDPAARRAASRCRRSCPTGRSTSLAARRCEEGERARAADLDLGERREVEQARPARGRRGARPATIGDQSRAGQSCARQHVAGSSSRVGLEPLRALPAGALEEVRAELELARRTAASARSGRDLLALLARVHDVVDLAVLLRAAQRARRSRLSPCASKRCGSHSCRSVRTSPRTISSASARPAPPECVTQIASHSHSPRAAAASPISGMPSGVNDISPLKRARQRRAADGGQQPRRSPRAARAKSSGVNGSIDGCPAPPGAADLLRLDQPRLVVGSCRSRSASPTWRKYRSASWWRRIGWTTSRVSPASSGSGAVTAYWCCDGDEREPARRPAARPSGPRCPRRARPCSARIVPSAVCDGADPRRARSSKPVTSQSPKARDRRRRAGHRLGRAQRLGDAVGRRVQAAEDPLRVDQRDERLRPAAGVEQRGAAARRTARGRSAGAARPSAPAWRRPRCRRRRGRQPSAVEQLDRLLREPRHRRATGCAGRRARARATWSRRSPTAGPGRRARRRSRPSCARW